MSTANSGTSTATTTGPTDVRGAAATLEALMTPAKPDTSKGNEAKGGTEETSPAETETTETPPAAETEEETQEETETETEEETPDGETHEVPDSTEFKIGEEAVSLGELKQGYLRQSDYTRKTQELAGARKTFEQTAGQHLGALQGERQQLGQALASVQDYLTNLMPKEPDWAVLAQEDPHQYAVQRELFRQFQQQLQGIEGKRRALAEKIQQGQAQQLKAYVNEQHEKLAQAFPDWADPKKTAVKDADFKRMRAWGEKNGISREEMDSLTDHRALVAIHKAALYDELIAKKPATTAQVKQPGSKVKVATPGSQGTKPGKGAEVTAAKRRLAQTGNVRDAAAVLEKFL